MALLRQKNPPVPTFCYNVTAPDMYMCALKKNPRNKKIYLKMFFF